MRTIKIHIISFLLAISMVFTACSGSELPDGMNEEDLFCAGKDVMLLLVNGEYEAVHTMLREDQRALFTVEDIRDAVASQLEGAGYYKQIDDHTATGQVVDGERYGVSVLYCEFSEEDVLIRISFDADMLLVGFSLKKQ